MKKAKIIFILLIIVLAGLFLWWNHGQAAVNPAQTTKQSFIIAPGLGIRDIAYKLKQKNLIKSPVVFFLTVKQLGLDGKIQAGNFQLSQSMTASQVAEALTHGTTDIWVTITPGKRAEEVGETLANALPNYDSSWKPLLTAQEGYLFPDTYLLPVTSDVATVIKIMRNNFDMKYAQAAKTKTVSLTQSQVVILASILEREGKSPSDMRLVASVLENRLSQGMPLQVDATVQYALGYQPVAKTWWKKDLTTDDLQINSPYNTYLNPGLPPTPIASPGLAALTAVLNPAQTSYLYYVSDAKGNLHFASTLQEHNANVAKYIQ